MRMSREVKPEIGIAGGGFRPPGSQRSHTASHAGGSVEPPANVAAVPALRRRETTPPVIKAHGAAGEGRGMDSERHAEVGRETRPGDSG